MSTRITITNYYTDRTNQTIETVDTPDALDNLEEWWDGTVLPLTGDGLGTRDYAIYEAVVTDSDNRQLIGMKHEWDG